MKTSRVLSAILALLFASVGTKAVGQTLYKGKLSPQLSMGSAQLLLLSPAPPEVIAMLPAPPAEGERVFERKLTPEIRVAMIMIAGKSDKYLYVDLNGNEKFEEKERFALPTNGDLDITLPLSAGSFKGLPMKIGSHPGNAFYLRVAFAQTANGTVNIGGHQTLVRYSLNRNTMTIDPTRGALMVDCDGDGKFAAYPSNVEAIPGRGKPVVFRVGTHYVITKSVNIDTGEIVMEERPASEYTRIELLEGGQVPDFSFKDFDGKLHKLSDLLGKNKYLLLDFWGSW